MRLAGDCPPPLASGPSLPQLAARSRLTALASRGGQDDDPFLAPGFTRGAIRPTMRRKRRQRQAGTAPRASPSAGALGGGWCRTSRSCRPLSGEQVHETLARPRHAGRTAGSPLDVTRKPSPDSRRAVPLELKPRNRSASCQGAALDRPVPRRVPANGSVAVSWRKAALDGLVPRREPASVVAAVELVRRLAAWGTPSSEAPAQQASSRPAAGQGHPQGATPLRRRPRLRRREPSPRKLP